MKKTLTYNLTFLITIAAFLIAPHVEAQQFKNRYKDWKVYTANSDGYKLCYIVSFPKKKTGNYHYRSDPYIMVTSIAGKKEEVSITSGYKYKRSTEPRVIIEGKEYRMSKKQDEIAWFSSDMYDRIAINKMKKGITLKIKSTSVKGTYSIDTYSLKGFTAAYNKMRKLCRSERSV